MKYLVLINSIDDVVQTRRFRNSGEGCMRRIGHKTWDRGFMVHWISESSFKKLQYMHKMGQRSASVAYDIVQNDRRF